MNNPRRLVLRDFASIKKLKILAPPGPTYWPTSARKNPDILDIFVSKIPSNLFHSTDNILDLNSDHSSVILTLNAYPLTSRNLLSSRALYQRNRLPSFKQKYNNLSNSLKKVLSKKKIFHLQTT